MAVTRREQEILDLADRGLSVGQIAERLQLKASYVSQRLCALTPDMSADRRRDEEMARCSRQLLAAIERERTAGALCP